MPQWRELISSRLQRESAFHDQAYTHAELRSTARKFYVVTNDSRSYYRSVLESLVKGKRILECGCGRGSGACELALFGAEVVGIDISPVAIDVAAGRARDEGLAAKASFQIMNLEELAFEDESFDLVCGTSILHHVDLERAYGEIARVLRVGGLALFREPLGHNPLFNLYRRRTPTLRTPDEHPLRRSDFELAERFFSQENTQYFSLCSLATVPFRRTRLFQPLLRWSRALDDLLLHERSPLKSWAWIVVMSLRK